MQYQIHGAHRNTGHNVCVVIDAQSERDAHSAAFAMDILVSDIEPVGLASAAMHAGQAAAVPAPPPPPLGGPPAHDRLRGVAARSRYRTPEYIWLNCVGIFFWSLGALVIVADVFIALIALAGGMSAASRSATPQGIALVTGATTIGGFVMGLTIGAMLLAVGHGLLALRDIARNSWSQARLEQASRL